MLGNQRDVLLKCLTNPTGVTMHQKWIGTRAQWRIPDNSWTGKRWKRTAGGLWPTRSILYPNLTAEELIAHYRALMLAEGAA